MYAEHMTAEVMQIDPKIHNFKQNLSLETANAMYNEMGGAKFCRCLKDCLSNKRCSCISLGKLCRPKCHGKRKDGKPVRCRNCPPKKRIQIKNIIIVGKTVLLELSKIGKQIKIFRLVN